MTTVLNTSVATLRAIVDVCLQALNAGELVVLPTDTVYGVAAHPECGEAVDAIYRAKLRDRGKPIPILACSLDAVLDAGASMSPAERRLAEQFWPGGLTLVLDVAGGTEGIRVPACEITRSVIDAAGGLLRVTSANRSGQPDATTVGDALLDLGEHVSVAVDAGDCGGGTPSTVARVEGDDVTVFRAGALSRESLVSVARDETVVRP